MPLFGLSESDVEKMEAKRDVKGLIKALAYKKDIMVRTVAARALGKIGDARATDGLVVALKDENPSVRSLAREALGKMGDARATEALKKIGEPANISKGIALLERGQYTEAVKCFDEALEINPNNGLALALKARAAMERDRWLHLKKF